MVTGAAATTSGTGSADLSRWTLDSEWQLAVDPGENRVAGAVPQVAILFQGPIDRPARTVDVTAFSAYLTLRAFEKEVRQVEIMQADILEQEFLRRTIARGEEAITRRIRAEEAERLRIEAEERAKAEAAARAAAEALEQGGAGQGGVGEGGLGQGGLGQGGSTPRTCRVRTVAPSKASRYPRRAASRHRANRTTTSCSASSAA